MTPYRERKERGDYDPERAAARSGYSEMTKDQLLAEAQARGISPANATMTKAELQAALEGGG